MNRLEARTFARCSSAVLASAVMACCAGCAGRVYAGPANPENLEVQPLAAAPVEDDSEVVYVQDPPVVDMETYPTMFYGGVQVYYVDGYWYHRGPRGWAYYRQEPADLGRQRQEHWQRDHDPRWAEQRGGDHRGQDNRGVTEAQPPDRRAPPPLPPPPPRALPRREERPAPPAPVVEPRRVEAPTPAPTVQPRRKQTPPPPPPPPRRVVPVRAPPAHPPAPQPEHR